MSEEKGSAEYKRKYMRQWYLANKDHVREKNRAWRKRNPDKVRLMCRKGNWRFHKRPTPTRPMPTHCECCGLPSKSDRALHLDHCHTTGKFRGWLCHGCNLGLGHFGDSIPRMELALDYLRGIR